MAKERSDKSPYNSRYSEGYVSAAQYITELVCEKKARKEKKELPIFFWKLAEWEKYFKSQIGSANQLLRKYDGAAIIKALMSPKMFSTYSLRAPWLLDEIIAQQAIIDSRPTEGTTFSEVDINKKPTNTVNPLQELMDLDNG